MATIVSNDVVGTPLCYTCHMETVYWSQDAGNSRFTPHPSGQSAHQKAPGCFSCHMWDYSATPGLGVSTTDWPGGADAAGSVPPPIDVFVHGQNKVWTFNEEDGSAGTGQPVDAFVNGYIANMDYTGSSCWAQTCKAHSNKGY